MLSCTGWIGLTTIVDTISHSVINLRSSTSDPARGSVVGLSGTTGIGFGTRQALSAVDEEITLGDLQRPRPAASTAIGARVQGDESQKRAA